MTRRKREHVFGQRVCTRHQLWLDGPCWCGVAHGATAVDHGDECPSMEDLLSGAAS